MIARGLLLPGRPSRALLAAEVIAQLLEPLEALSLALPGDNLGNALPPARRRMVWGLGL